MENQACPCGGWGGPCLQPHAGGKGHLSPRENPPFSFAAASKRAYAGGLFEARLSQATRGGGSAHLRPGGQAGYFRPRRLGGGAGAAGAADRPPFFPGGARGQPGPAPQHPPPPAPS